MKGPRGVRPPLSVARRPHSPLSRVPPQNSSSSQGPGMVREERWPPDPAFPPLDARRAPHTCANARPALGALYWGRRPCPAKPAHPHAPAPPCAPCPPPSWAQGWPNRILGAALSGLLGKTWAGRGPPSLATCPPAGGWHTPSRPANTSTPILPGAVPGTVPGEWFQGSAWAPSATPQEPRRGLFKAWGAPPGPHTSPGEKDHQRKGLSRSEDSLDRP